MMTEAKLLQFCRDYECETLSEVLLAVAESSRHCTSEGGGRIPTWPLKEAASRLSEMDAENKRLRAFVQRVSEIPSPRKRPEDDIDALYQNEEHFAAVIDAARAALEQQQKGEKL